jgi:tetratricopeptide (TPR) repeat protein
MVDTLGWMNEWAQVGRLLDEWLPRYHGSRDLLVTRVVQLMNSGDLAGARELFSRIPANSNTLYSTVGNDLHRWQRDYPALIAFWDQPDIYTDRSGGRNAKLLWQGMAHKFMGDKQTAGTPLRQYVVEMEVTTTTTNNAEAARLSSLAQAYAHLGEFDLALERARQAVEAQPREKDHLFGTTAWNNQTWVMAMAGQREEAIARLAEKLDRPEGLSSWELALDPSWDFLRDEPAFAALYAGKQIRENRP